MTSSPRFDPKAIAFLRQLKRNNRREWFQPRKEEFDRLLRAPMLEIIERLGADFQRFAPEIAASPKSLFRIYRDTRFSDDKTPYKTHVSAFFPTRELPKQGGGALYFEITPQRLWAGGGIYAPDTSLLQAEREHIAANFRRLRAIVDSPGFRRVVGTLEGGDRLQRVPRGFASDHPAADLLRCRMFVAGHEFPAKVATTARFYPGLLNVFRHLLPFLRFLNEPLIRARSSG